MTDHHEAYHFQKSRC